MMRMDATDSLEPSTAPLQLSHTVRWILCSSNTVAAGMKDWWSPSRSGTPGSRFASLAPEALLQSRKGGTKHSHHQTSCQNVFQVFSVGKNVSWCSRARCLLEEASKTGN